MTKSLKVRLRDSALDFVKGVQPALERRLDVEIFPIEGVESNKLYNRLDQIGVDGFYFDKRQMRCLASRVNYHSYVARKPEFSFRCGLWERRKQSWDGDREFTRKVEAFQNPDRFNLFPTMHVESFSKEKGSGKIGWSFAAEMKDIISYFHKHYEDSVRIHIYEPKSGERRKVLTIPVELFAEEYGVIEIGGR